MKGLPVRVTAAILLAVPAAAQVPVPAAEPLAPTVYAPRVSETRLGSRAVLRWIPAPGTPLMAAHVVFPLDPAREPETSAALRLLAAAMEAGPAPDPEGRGGAVAGVTLRASLDPDALSLRVVAPSEQAESALRLLVEAAYRPRLDVVATDSASGRAAAGGDGPGSADLAERALVAALWGSTEAAFAEPTAEASGARVDEAELERVLADLRRRRATFVVASDRDRSDVTALVASTFAGAGGLELPDPVAGSVSGLDLAGAARPAAGPTVVAVHRPGGADVHLRVGLLLPPAASEDWPALALLAQVLGDPRSGRLDEAFAGRPARATLHVVRRRGLGRLDVHVRTPLWWAEQALALTLGEIERAGREILAPERVAGARDALLGAARLSIESAPQQAERIAAEAALGLPPGSLDAWQREVAGIEPVALAEVASRWLGSARARVAAVGDARRLQPVLRAAGSVSIVDEHGTPLDEIPAIAARPAPLDASRLAPFRLRYDLSRQGVAVGSLLRELTSTPAEGTRSTSEASMRVRSVAEIGLTRLEQDVTFVVPSLRPLAASSREEGPRASSMTLSVARGRAAGRLRTGSGERTFAWPVPEGALLGDVLELALALAPLEEGEEFTLPALRPDDGGVEHVPVRVGAVEPVCVPAGRFEAYRVDVGGSEARTVWIAAAAPHAIVRVEPADRPLLIELEAIEVLAGAADGPRPPVACRP